MINGKHFFSIHNDLGLFLFSVTLATDSTYISVLYFRILFLYSERTYTLLQIFFIFPTKTVYTLCIPIITKLHLQWSTYNRTEEFTVAYTVTKNKLRCILSSVFVWPQHLIHITCNVFPGLAANPSMKSINCYISTCVFHSLEKGYTHLWILVIHFHLQSKKKSSIGLRIAEYGERYVNN